MTDRLPDAARHRRTGPVAPVRYPVDLASSLRALFGSGVVPGVLTGSGEDALALAVGCAIDAGLLPRGGAVVVPDFICSSVPRALARAGVRAVFAELDPTGWSYAAGALEDALAAGARGFLVVSYFGLPTVADATARARLAAAARGACAIEDLAQGYGLDPAARMPEARFAIYSFGRGKSLPLAWGGLVEACGAREAAALAARPRAARAGFAASAANLVLAQLQRALLHPLAWRFVPLPEGAGVHDVPARERRAPGRLIEAYLAAAASRHRDVVARRRANAVRLRAALAALDEGLGLPAEEALRGGVALRLPVLLPSERAARRAHAELARRGVLKGPNTWQGYARAGGNAAAIAARLLTLPTHPGSEDAADRAVAILHAVLRG